MRTFRKILAPLASLQITVVLIGLSMVLILAGTLAQKDVSIQTALSRYFYTFFTRIDPRLFFPRNPKFEPPGMHGFLYWPGGYTIGIAVLINLLAAHILRFQFRKATWLTLPPLALMFYFLQSWEAVRTPLLLVAVIASCAAFLAVLLLVHLKRAGVILIHLALIILVVGEGISSWSKVENMMQASPGEPVAYLQDPNSYELAIVEASRPDVDAVAVIPARKLIDDATVSDPALPVSVKVNTYAQNARLTKGSPTGTAGVGRIVGIEALPVVSSIGPANGQADVPAADVTFMKDGKSLGRYVVSPHYGFPQELYAGDKTYLVELRLKRTYLPYTLELQQFTFDRYQGTDIAKNYASLVTLKNPATGENRDIRIWMNHPLNYDGKTFYQADFNHQTENTSILQVVSNPGQLLPYVACALGALGLLLHFIWKLVVFARRTFRTSNLDREAEALARATPGLSSAAAAIAVRKGQKPRNAPPSLPKRGVVDRPPSFKPFWAQGSTWIAMGMVAFCAVYVMGKVIGGPQEVYHYNDFARIPVNTGRVKPIDSLARESLKKIVGKESFYNGDDKISAVQWLLDTVARPEVAKDYRIFRIDDADLSSLFSAGKEQRYFTWAEIEPIYPKLRQQVNDLRDTPKAQYNAYQADLVELWGKLMTFQSLYGDLGAMGDVHVLPPEGADNKWGNLVEASDRGRSGQDPGKTAKALVGLLYDYTNQNSVAFNRDVSSYLSTVEGLAPDSARRASVEAYFNRVDPFLSCAVLYGFGFLLAISSLMGWHNVLRKSAFGVLALAVLVHTIGLICRIYISEHGPITNLYSSAVFVGWGAALAALIFESFFKNALSLIAGGVLGALCLIFAFCLIQGDTMEPVIAVLDTNFWLATHVPTINLGYAATLLSGIFGVIYLFMSASRNADAGVLKLISRMTYGALCFAITASFIGTVLGGIWADQSWGRFWGWDPKENGAVLVVLWNALVLHARWAGLVRDKGFAVLSVFGNIVVAWSWMGTNLLGVGLHAYGFLSGFATYTVIFCILQLGFMCLGFLNRRKAPPPPAAA